MNIHARIAALHRELADCFEELAGQDECARRAHGSGAIERLESGKFRARIRAFGKRISLGTSDSSEEAEQLVVAASEALRDWESEDARFGRVLLRSVDPPEHGGVYAVQAAGPFVKIGRANNIRMRMATMQTFHPVALRLLGILSRDTFEEDAIHLRLSLHRVRGEWFELNSHVLSTIRELHSSALRKREEARA